MMTEGREHTFDIMKGVGIILMIIGHCAIPWLLGNFIFSFHMPLFFIISGFFFKPKPVVQQLKIDFKRLVIPYLFICLLLIIYGFIKDLVKNTEFINTQYFAIASLWGSGTRASNALWADIPNIWVVWFLLALLWCRVLFSYFYNKNSIYIVLSSIMATLICQFVFLPFSLLPGLSALLFYYLGHLANKWRIFEKKIPIFIQYIMGIIWIYCILYSRLDVACCHYDCYPIDILGALSGCYFIYVICKYINDKDLIIKNILLLFGKLSLIVLCFHNIDLFVIPWKTMISELFNLLNIASNRYIIAILIIICRLIWALAIVFFVPKIAVCRRIFSISISSK
jgi:fucose 4-O-acetylase-like acetyltransferase